MQQIEKWMIQFFQEADLQCMRKLKTFTTRYPMTMQEAADLTSSTVQQIIECNPWMRNFGAADFVLRAGTRFSYPSVVLGVSYSVDGLKWACNNLGRGLFFTNAILHQTDSGPQFRGDISRSKDIWVGPFIPKDHYIAKKMDFSSQKAEYLWANKGLHLMYTGSPSLSENINS